MPSVSLPGYPAATPLAGDAYGSAYGAPPQYDTTYTANNTTFGKGGKGSKGVHTRGGFSSGKGFGKAGGGGKGSKGGKNPSTYPAHPGKVFVGNLPPDITKDALYRVFSTYGHVFDLHVMLGKADSGQACAFVEYTTQFEAETAIECLHNNYEIRVGEGKIICRFYEKTGPKGKGKGDESLS